MQDPESLDEFAAKRNQHLLQLHLYREAGL